MSWSVSASGKAAAVYEEIERQFREMNPCMGNEECVKQAARQAINIAIGAQDPLAAIKVTASGHQGAAHVHGHPIRITHTMTIEVEPLFGFVG